MNSSRGRVRARRDNGLPALLSCGTMQRMCAPSQNFSVWIESRGWKFEAPPSVSLLEAARLSKFVLPSSCRNGTCRTCMCRMKSGRVRYAIEWPGLSADEEKDGYILPCVAFAESDLVLEFE